MEKSMKRKLVLLLVLSFVCSAFFSCAEERGAKPAILENELSADGQKIVDYLLDDWDEQGHSTSISLAMKILDMKPNDTVRLEVGEHFRAHTDLANNLKWRGTNNYILSNDEKLIAKYLINTYTNEKRIPDLKELSEEVGIPESNLNGRLNFMAQAGLLQASSNEKLGYALTDKYNRWGGPLRYNFHTVAQENAKAFDVWWGVDFLLLVNSYGDKKVEIEDSCMHCSKRINLTIEKGEIASLSPETVWIQQGGGWAVDNLFWSEEHLTDWLDSYPEYKELTHANIGEFLENVKSKHN